MPYIWSLNDAHHKHISIIPFNHQYTNISNRSIRQTYTVALIWNETEFGACGVWIKIWPFLYLALIFIDGVCCLLVKPFSHFYLYCPEHVNVFGKNYFYLFEFWNSYLLNKCWIILSISLRHRKCLLTSRLLIACHHIHFSVKSPVSMANIDDLIICILSQFHPWFLCPLDIVTSNEDKISFVNNKSVLWYFIFA